ncbi:E3 ubiquitin-protein ligase bre1 [Coemansia biformis]|uniref:E3 ubiquitin protein ligase n=1 Tax=Coemansia biformis TaxID=1286918 RepID=A0A9W7YGV7_9FUNG|nr:E3 ubiquitin-protein ligase bre1 [Coemansia biformis]
MTERKKRSEDGRDMDDVQPPPSLAKKRHTTKESDFQTLSAEFDENASMLDLESIREFQKEAIWRQMKEYKRDAQRATGRTAAAEQRQAWWEERISGICAQWDRAIRDLDTIFNTADAAVAKPPSDAATQEAWLDIMLPRKIPSSHHAAPAAAGGSGLDGAQSGIERFYASVNKVLRQLQARSSASDVDWAAAADRLSRSRAAQDYADELKSEMALLSRRLSESKEALEQRENELRRALKRLDRKICPTVRDDDGDGARPGADASREPGSSSPADADADAAAAAAAAGPVDGRLQAASPAAVSTPDTGGAAATNGGVAPGADTQQTRQTQPMQQAEHDATEYRLLAVQRLAEIEEKMRENTELVMQVDSLRLQIASVPDYIISETALFKQMEAGRNHYGAQAQRLQAEVERLLAEVGELRTSRVEFEEGIAATAAAQRTALEAEMQRLQSDLVRVRHHRDQVQRELEERRAQDAVEDQKSTELKLLSDVRRERMNALISENKRLLACIAVLRGDRSAFETYTDEELSKATAVADELRAKLEQVARREKHLAEQLGALSVQSDGDGDGSGNGGACASSPAAQRATGETDATRLVGELQRAREEAERHQRRAQKYEEILGGEAVDAQGCIVAEAAATGGDLAAKQRRIEALTLERDGLAKTSEMMERELQTICESFAKLEEQNTSKVWDLGQKEQAIARVIAEKSKYEEKFIGLNKDREAQRMANQALRSQSAKQVEHIKAIEERDRALAQQLSLLESEAQHATQAWHATQAQLQEAQQRALALEEQALALEERVRAATAALGERTESLSAMEHARRRAEEALAAAAQRASEAEKVTDQTGLAKLCADYKALLKCPTCQTNFKSHTLLRCMHVFCKQCIDSRIETRQRKCPSCSEPFGAKDVRQIYL